MCFVTSGFFLLCCRKFDSLKKDDVYENNKLVRHVSILDAHTYLFFNFFILQTDFLNPTKAPLILPFFFYFVLEYDNASLRLKYVSSYLMD